MGRIPLRYRTIYKNGSSYVISIPKEVMNNLDIGCGDMMIVKDDGINIIIEKAS